MMKPAPMQPIGTDLFSGKSEVNRNSTPILVSCYPPVFQDTGLIAVSIGIHQDLSVFSASIRSKPEDFLRLALNVLIIHAREKKDRAF
jgi:hypothetical protein